MMVCTAHFNQIVYTSTLSSPGPIHAPIPPRSGEISCGQTQRAQPAPPAPPAPPVTRRTCRTFFFLAPPFLPPPTQYTVFLRTFFFLWLRWLRYI